MNDRESRRPLDIAPVQQGHTGPKTQSPAPRAFAGEPSPSLADASCPNAFASLLWIVVPAVAAVMAAFSFLVCGGLSLFLLSGGSSDTYSESQPHVAYSDPAYIYSSDATVDSANYVPAAYAPDAQYIDAPYIEPTVVEPAYSAPAYVEPAYAEPAYVDPGYVEPAYAEPATVDPGYVDPVASSSSSGSGWSFDDPASELVAAIARDEEELVGMDAAILAARAGEIVGEVEAQDGETALDQLFGVFFSVGSDAIEQQLLAERAVVQARLDANRAELVRVRGY